MKKLIALSVFAASAFAQPGPGRWGGQAPAFTELKTYLGLTDTQVQGLQQLRQSQRTSLQANFAQMRQKHEALRTALQSGSASAATVGQLMLDIEALRKQTRESHAKLHDQAVNTLTPEQKAKLKTLEDAAKLRPVIGQAGALALLTPPEPSADGAGFGPRRGMGGFGPEGFRAPRMRPPGPAVQE